WGTEPNTSRPWVIDYNTANKPSAGDVGALPITGGCLNGRFRRNDKSGKKCRPGDTAG
ncbi:shikimate transporter, partial [Salmonella enterica subsp. enterica]|nr:shikimate transporter [Salmonella enterica subsp. enterica serovar Montevideo]EBZ5449909.1 shikimate transporter [Salmonella enterica subsp. enterica serovar Montevideo]ECK0472774.1 shikimate transporter [Salmonella enterica subsp. enterica serovar Montevideo]